MRKHQWPTVIACYIMVIAWVLCLSHSLLLGIVLWAICAALIGLSFDAKDYVQRGITLVWPIALAFHALSATFSRNYREWAFTRTGDIKQTRKDARK